MLCVILWLMRHSELLTLAERMGRKAELIRRVDGRVGDQLSGTRFTGTSGGIVTVEVDHHARLLDVHLAPTGLTRTRGADLGRHIVAALAAARTTARSEYQRTFQATAVST